jgi:ubiquinone/menaquinone biosynthesis C-methylase UbiE
MRESRWDETGPAYDAEHVAAYFDEHGEREWARFDENLAARVNFEVHRRYLERFVQRGHRVLEVGAGPGRFTLELARLGATVVVADVSREMLRLNREHVGAEELEAQVEARVIVDVLDLSRFEDGEFDATVCYGGPVSYVVDRADEALAELLRVTRPGGPVLLSVMSLVGAFRAFLPQAIEVVEEYGVEATEHIIETGYLGGVLNRHHNMRMYSWAMLKELLDRHGCEVVAASASNFLSIDHDDVVTDEWWPKLVEWELRVCAEPGALDGGTHILAVVTRPQG